MIYMYVLGMFNMAIFALSVDIFDKASSIKNERERKIKFLVAILIFAIAFVLFGFTVIYHLVVLKEKAGL